LNCKACSREAEESGYCRLHAKAHESVNRKYNVWKKALEISWKEYLSEIVKNPLTGEWVKEVAEQLARDGEKQNGADS
jgi:hypothetical protein